MNKGYRLTESKLRGIIREMVRSVLNESKDQLGKFDNDSFNRLRLLADQTDGQCSFSLNDIKFTLQPIETGYHLSSERNFGYNTKDIEEALTIAFEYSNDDYIRTDHSHS